MQKGEVMRTEICKSRPLKKSANLSIRSDLLQVAKNDNINLSQMLEQVLTEYCKKKQQQVWIEENSKAFCDYNRLIEEHGLYCDGRKLF